jgi:RHS repeat-associated protein
VEEVASSANSATLSYDADFYPYGSEQAFVSTSSPIHKFTGKERDTETGNDYFGARYYSSTIGRFMSADWSSVPVAVPYANLTNPQTLNLYAMVRDNPETFADLDGHTGECTIPNACNQTAQPSHTPPPGEDGQAQQQKSGDSQPVPPPTQQQTNNGNVIYNETSGLRTTGKNGAGNGQDLHNSRVGIGHVLLNRERAGVKGGVASDRVSSRDRRTAQYRDAQAAAAEAVRSPDNTRGSQHFYLDYGQPKPSWARGQETITYGPFLNAAGGGDVPQGADVYIVIVLPR